MKTIWTGDSLILQFQSREITLDIEETKEFEQWVQDRVLRKEN